MLLSRKDFLAVSGTLAIGLMPSLLSAAPDKPLKTRTTLHAKKFKIQLKHKWTIARGTSAVKNNVIVKITKDGITGYGEAAPNVRYGESWQTTKADIEKCRPVLGDIWKFHQINEQIEKAIKGDYAAKAAVDIAVFDWIGKKLSLPIYRYFGLDKKKTPLTSFSIGIDKIDIMQAKVKEAHAYPILKIKVGTKEDEEIIKGIRKVTDKTLRVDANEGWTDKEEAVRKINWLASQGVEFVEQPMPSAQLEDVRWVRQRVNIPLVADESVLHPEDIPKLAGVYDGINIKLMKCGGILKAYQMINIARALKMKIMLGCMIETSIGITAAAHLTPLVDYADLDGNLLIDNDPVAGVTVKEGKLLLPDGAGLGLTEFRS